MSQHAQGLIDIGSLILKFAQVNRVTLYPDGQRHESDTDHTVMLSVCACALAEALYKDRLDIGKVAQFALIHDLVEVHVGDTNTINITKEGRDEKNKREDDSFEKIKREFKDIYPWIHTTILSYENRDTPEARFVKILDKAMSKITNTLDRGAALKKLGTSKEEITRHFSVQTKEYEEKYGKEFPELLSILKELMDTMLKNIYHNV